MTYRIKPLRWFPLIPGIFYYSEGLIGTYEAQENHWTKGGKSFPTSSIAEAMRGAYNDHVAAIKRFLQEVK